MDRHPTGLPDDYPGAGPLGATDPLLWRLDSSDSGRHVWHYLPAGQNELTGESPFLGNPREQNFEEKHWLGLPTVSTFAASLVTERTVDLDYQDAPELSDPQGDPLKAASNAYEYYKQMQAPDGHW